MKTNFELKSLRSRRTLFSVAAAVAFLSPSAAEGGHIAPAFRDILRIPMPNEGYLNYHAANPLGEERTGWTDVRHPANDGTRDIRSLPAASRGPVIGYDRSDNFVQVHNKVLTIRNEGNTANVPANPNIQRDYNYANEIYAQAGISVLSTGVQPVSFLGQNANHPVVTEPISPAEQRTIQRQDRQGGTVVNNWYGTRYEDDLQGATFRPDNAAAFSGTMILDTATGPDTFAHELGHFLLGAHKFADAVGQRQGHSADPDDLMVEAGIVPNNTIKQQSGTLPADRMANSPQIGAPRQSGRLNNPPGDLGITSHFDEPVKLNGMGANIEQIVAIHNSAFVQRNDDNGPQFGDRADFDWVEDNINLENQGRADYHAGGRDRMVWTIGQISSRDDHAGHDHDDWGELDLPSFDGPFFRTIDVVSQVARYMDMDHSLGLWTLREAALDYLVEFSRDGTNYTAVPQPIDIFVQGWTDRSHADDYVARWVSPFDALFVRISAVPNQTDGHDGAAQIDAIIASRSVVSPVPEPSGLALLATGVAGLLGCRLRRWGAG